MLQGQFNQCIFMTCILILDDELLARLHCMVAAFVSYLLLFIPMIRDSACLGLAHQFLLLKHWLSLWIMLLKLGSSFIVGFRSAPHSDVTISWARVTTRRMSWHKNGLCNLLKLGQGVMLWLQAQYQKYHLYQLQSLWQFEASISTMNCFIL